LAQATFGIVPPSRAIVARNVQGIATMPKTAILTFLAAAMLGSGAALASERTMVEPTAPSFVRELGPARTATVGGTVVEIRPDGRFVLADAEGGRIRLDAERLRLDGLAPGQAITVTGRLDDGALEAGHAIREDGSVAVRAARAHDEKGERD
jgi:hypothetical protein